MSDPKGRRRFIRKSAALAALGICTPAAAGIGTGFRGSQEAGLSSGMQGKGVSPDRSIKGLSSGRSNIGKMVLRYRPYELQLKHAFTLATSSRTTTPVMLTEIHYEGVTGYGEASMPPYLGESHSTASDFLSRVRLEQFNDPFLLEDILAYVDGIAPGNAAAKASVDIALHDLVGKLMEEPWHRIWGLNKKNTPHTSFTIGIDTEEVVREKVKEATGMKILKVKLGRGNDREMIRWVRSVTVVPLCVDVNQGWTDREMALDMTHWLKDQGVVFVEQPMPVGQVDDLAWLTGRSPLPVVADESVQRLKDIGRLRDVYSGINVKLMKSTGMREAWKMIIVAKNMGMKVLIGCMTETSCAVSAAAQISPMADWADLDGNLLISNDLFHGMEVIEGKVTLNDLPGIGITSA